ncbi:3-phenylpropionate/cinnamic acid dioxygenase small subunit [Streptomyces sp. SLBN-118]|uniref:nuclear transport factor 2 family protein n=1 Tax=Streptomyces sp. SLBN-118 TaxID=2768454 RepID=UPI00116DF322|nr:nuclear transport factor 2 family protein [Streptomyces sp. SLBN-118]TQK43188.1 3-phenylpropionate/cinnamic acid dioxygenase small subunit [Streptomyces sp. SLBN-118]
MTQRVDLATVMDRLAIDELITSYAVAVDDSDWHAYRALFAREGRADYRSSGGIEGPAAEVADWMAEAMRLFPVRQHLIVNRRLHIQDLGGYPGDRAEVQADYVNPMRLESGDDFVSGGRYTFGLLRTDAGWRLHTVVIHEKWRRAPEALGGA